MKFPLPLGLVFAISLSGPGALPLAAQPFFYSPPEPEQLLVPAEPPVDFSSSPTPSPAPQFLLPPAPPVDLIPEPRAEEALPSRGKRRSLKIGPIPSPSPPRDDVHPAPPVEPTAAPKVDRVLFPIPPPNPAPVIPPPPVSAPAPFLAGRPDLQRFERARPEVEVWRDGSLKPQRPKRQGPGRFRVWTVGAEPVTIVLRFHQLLAGRTITLMSGVGVTVSEGVLTLGPGGETTFAVQLEANRRAGEIAFNLDSITTVLRLQRAPAEAVEGFENESVEETP